MNNRGKEYIIVAVLVVVLSASIAPLNLVIMQVINGNIHQQGQYNVESDRIVYAVEASSSMENLTLPRDVLVVAVDRWTYDMIAGMNATIIQASPATLLSTIEQAPDYKVLVIAGRAGTLSKLLDWHPSGGPIQDIKAIASKTPLILIASDKDANAKAMLLGRWMSLATVYGYPVDRDVVEDPAPSVRDGVNLDRRLVATGILGLATIPWDGEPIGGFLHADDNLTVAEAIVDMALEIRGFASIKSLDLPPGAQLILFTGYDTASSVLGKMYVGTYYYHYKPGPTYDVFFAFVRQSLKPYIWGTRGMTTIVDWHADTEPHQSILDWGPKNFGCGFTISFDVSLGIGGPSASISYTAPIGTSFCHSDTTDPSEGRQSVGHGFYGLPLVTHTVEPASSGIVDSVALDQGKLVKVTVGALSDIAGPLWHTVYLQRPGSQGPWGFAIAHDMQSRVVK